MGSADRREAGSGPRPPAAEAWFIGWALRSDTEFWFRASGKAAGRGWPLRGRRTLVAVAVGSRSGLAANTYNVSFGLRSSTRTAYNEVALLSQPHRWGTEGGWLTSRPHVPLCISGGDRIESWHLTPESVLVTTSLQSGWKGRGSATYVQSWRLYVA